MGREHLGRRPVLGKLDEREMIARPKIRAKVTENARTRPLKWRVFDPVERPRVGFGAVVRSPRGDLGREIRVRADEVVDRGARVARDPEVAELRLHKAPSMILQLSVWR